MAYPHCRSMLVPIMLIGEDKPTSGEDWVKKRTLEQLQAQFGKGVGKLLHDGTINLNQAVKHGGLLVATLKDIKKTIDPLARFASNKINSVSSSHFRQVYTSLSHEISKYPDLSTIELRRKLEVGIKWEIAILNKETQRLFDAKTNQVWLSDDTLIKQIRHRQGQPIDIKSYQLVNDIINNADELVIESENNIIFFKQNNDWYKAVVKTTRNKNELYLLSFSRSNENEVSRKTGKKKATR